MLTFSRRALRKARKLWTRQSKSPKSAEIICDILGQLFLIPGETRWNSVYDAISCILAFPHDLVIKTMTELKLEPLDESDFEFMQELKKVYIYN